MDSIDTAAIDAAAAAAAELPPVPAEPSGEPAPEATAEPALGPTLALNATGPDVVKLTNLLAYLGYATAETHGKAELDGDVLADLDKAREELGIHAENASEVGPADWSALYEAAAGKAHGGAAD